MIAVALVCFGVFLYLCFVYMYPRKNGKLPNGPKGIPIFGNLLQFNKKRLMVDMAEMGNNFDDAFTLKLFNQYTVVLNSFECITEALMSEKYAVAFSGRPRSFGGTYIFKGDLVFKTYSEEWSALRKVVFRGLKMYGSNMADVEELVQGEIHHLLGRIQNGAGTSVDPLDYVNGYVTSIISMLITGRHLKQEHEQLKLLGHIIDDIDQIFDPGTFQLLTMFPWLRHIPFGCGKFYQRLMQNILQLETHIAEDRLNRTADVNRKQCFLDFMHEEVEKCHITKENVTGVMLDLLVAGTGTSRSALYSLCLILTARPDVQRKIQNEIDEVIGRSRLPCSRDKSSLPFTQAVLWEYFRLYPPIVLPLPRSTTMDVEIKGYVIPRDTTIFYNIWLVHHDGNFWKDPYVFNPARFLDDTGNLLPPEHENRHRMIAFGLGKRHCIGETIGRLRIFLFLVSVLQSFTLLPDPNHPLPDTDPRTFNAGGQISAPQYKIIFEQRCP